MTQPEVSVVIPAYNAEHSLNETVRSVLDQTFKDVEIIVVNDGSTDGTERVALSYKENITYAKQENMGQGAARNKGIDLATGRYIAFLDADDYWLPDFLKTCVEYLESEPGVVAVSTGLLIRHFDGRTSLRPSFVTRDIASAEPVVLENFFDFWAEHDHLCTGAAVIRRSVVDEAGGQRADLRISQDVEYWAYLATFGRWAFIPIALWVGNSRGQAAASWSEKYRLRRRLCPSVEAWQQRVSPRIKDHELPGFRRVRGRVAAGYAHAKILAGAAADALAIVERYGADMPRNRLTTLMRLGARSGALGWRASCEAIRLREIAKAFATRLGPNGRTAGP